MAIREAIPAQANIFMDQCPVTTLVQWSGGTAQLILASVVSDDYGEFSGFQGRRNDLCHTMSISLSKEQAAFEHQFLMNQVSTLPLCGYNRHHLASRSVSKWHRLSANLLYCHDGWISPLLMNSLITTH